jgi:hypothetical protein
MAAFASAALFVTLFLPWYQVTLIAPARSAKLQSASAAITGWGAFSFVEAAVLLVAAGVLTLLFQRAEGRAFHLPGGDGGVITAAGIWTCALIVWRIFDKQGATTQGPSATSSGVEWGIFVALAAAGFLAYSGSRIRAAHRPEPPLPGENRAPVGSNAAADTTEVPRRRQRAIEPRWRDSATEVRRRDASPETGPSDARTKVRPREAPTKVSRRDAPTEVRRQESTVESARPASAPQPIPADRPPARETDRAPARETDRGPADRPAPPTDGTLARPRRRLSADELFERVVPEDPPAVRFGRIPPAPDPGILAASTRSPVDPPPPDDQLTIPFQDDDTLPLAQDVTVRLGEDDTRPLRPRPKR